MRYRSVNIGYDTQYYLQCFQGNVSFPYNRDIFTDEDFASSDVTDQSLEKENELMENKVVCSYTHNFDKEDSNKTRTASPSILLTSDHVLSRTDLLVKPPNEDLVLLTVEEPLSYGPPAKPPFQSSIELLRLSELAFRVL